MRLKEMMKNGAFSKFQRGFAPWMRCAALSIACFVVMFLTFASDSMAQQVSAYNDCMAKLESSGGCIAGTSPGYTCTNTKGCVGRYQFCPSTARDIASKLGETWSPESFRNDPAQQERFMAELTRRNTAYVDRHMSQYIGTTLNGVTVTREGLIGGCHLLGCGGVQSCLSGSGDCVDGYSTNVSRYLGAFGDANSCQLGSNPNPAITGTNLMCDPNIKARVSEQVNMALTNKNAFVATNFTPPAPVAQVANTPCMSQELQRIGNQFAYALNPVPYSNMIVGSLNMAGGPISGLVMKFFSAEKDGLLSAAQSINSGMLNLQSMASTAITGLLGNLVGPGFSSALCGIMVDMLLKYVQCAVPFQMPTLGNFLGSLDSLIPNNCAGNALRMGMTSTAMSRMMETVNQPITVNSGGTFVPGSASALNSGQQP